MIFQTEKEKNEAKEKLKNLSHNPDWLFFIEKVIEPIEKGLSEIILDDIFVDFKEEMKIRAERKSYLALKELPQKIINEIEMPEKEIKSFDPY